MRLSIAFLLLLSAATFGHAFDDESEGVKKFKMTVAGQGRTILALAHPLGKYRGLAFDDYKKNGDLREMACTIGWIGTKQENFATTFAFNFKLGINDQVEALKIDVPKDTCPTKAWKGSNLVLGPFRIKVKNKIQQYVDDEDILKSVDRITRAEGLLELWLMYVDRVPKK